jgi:hypothetical protein
MWQPPGQPAYGLPGGGPPGRVRDTGLAALLFIVTCGFYSWYWMLVAHDEMRRHAGDGLGGLVALLLWIIVAPVMMFLTPMEVGQLYERHGWPPPVSPLTGLWVLLPIAGPIVWFVKTSGALNGYWRAVGAA